MEEYGRYQEDGKEQVDKEEVDREERGGRILKDLVEVDKGVLTSADKEEVDKEETKRKDMDSIMEGMRRF